MPGTAPRPSAVKRTGVRAISFSHSAREENRSRGGVNPRHRRRAAMILRAGGAPRFRHQLASKKISARRQQVEYNNQALTTYRGPSTLDVRRGGFDSGRARLVAHETMVTSGDHISRRVRTTATNANRRYCCRAGAGAQVAYADVRCGTHRVPLPALQRPGADVTVFVEAGAAGAEVWVAARRRPRTAAARCSEHSSTLRRRAAGVDLSSPAGLFTQRGCGNRLPGSASALGSPANGDLLGVGGLSVADQACAVGWLAVLVDHRQRHPWARCRLLTPLIAEREERRRRRKPAERSGCWHGDRVRHSLNAGRTASALRFGATRCRSFIQHRRSCRARAVSTASRPAVNLVVVFGSLVPASRPAGRVLRSFSTTGGCKAGRAHTPAPCGACADGMSHGLRQASSSMRTGTS